MRIPASTVTDLERAVFEKNDLKGRRKELALYNEEGIEKARQWLRDTLSISGIDPSPFWKPSWWENWDLTDLSNPLNCCWGKLLDNALMYGDPKQSKAQGKTSTPYFRRILRATGVTKEEWEAIHIADLTIDHLCNHGDFSCNNPSRKFLIFSEYPFLFRESRFKQRFLRILIKIT